MNLSKIKKALSNTITATALRDLGLHRVPILPDGATTEALILAYTEAGQPDGTFFQDHLLITPEEWEQRQQKPAPPSAYDPISGDPLSTEEAAEWVALAPIKVLGGAVIAAADLIAFGAAKGLIKTSITSEFARLALPSGADPITPPAMLAEAARAWPYDPSAAEIAMDRRSGRSRAAVPTLATPIGSPPWRNQTTRDEALQQFLSSCFADDELRRFMLFTFGGRFCEKLPGPTVSRASYASAAVEQMHQEGLINGAFFDRLTLARPRRGAEIVGLRNAFNC